MYIVVSDKALRQNTLAILLLRKSIMANFDKQNDAIEQLRLDVVNAVADITELVTQIQNAPQDQGLVDANTQKVLDIATSLETSLATVPVAPVQPVDGNPVGGVTVGEATQK